jgi:molecular chaperone HscB
VTGADHFAVLGIPRRLSIEKVELDAAFLRLSRELHPDRFAGASPEEKALIERRSASVNDAYRALKDPVARAEHLLALEGVGRPDGEAKCPPDLLAEVFELKERAEEDGGAAAAEARRLLSAAESSLTGLFSAFDAASDAAARRAVLARARAALDRRKFLSSLVREIEQGTRKA